MGNNDYGMIVYRVLSRVHDGLKNSHEVHLDDLVNDTKAFPINERYWRTVLTDLIESEYITGLIEVKRIGGSGFKEDTSGLALTMKGAEYLSENSLMAKARDFVGPVLDVASLIVK